jgi:hypothetical protein
MNEPVEPVEPVEPDPPKASVPEGAEAGSGLDGIRFQLQKLERLFAPGANAIKGAEEKLLLPAWRRITKGEPRWPVTVAIVSAIGLQIVLPHRLTFRPHLLFPILEGLLLVSLFVNSPSRIAYTSPRTRGTSMVMIALLSLSNAWSAGKLVGRLVRGRETSKAPILLLHGSFIWLTNIVVFALWYWQFDRGGPSARALAAKPYPDFVFPQMQTPEFAPADWEPMFPDYLYLSFTNATAFSPTDVLPFSRWAKFLMMVQTLVSLSTVALVVSRAVNILG